MKSRLLVLGQLVVLQHPFHLSEQRPIGLGQFFYVDHVVIRSGRPAVQSERHVEGCGRIMEAGRRGSNSKSRFGAVLSRKFVAVDMPNLC